MNFFLRILVCTIGIFQSLLSSESSPLLENGISLEDHMKLDIALMYATFMKEGLPETNLRMHFHDIREIIWGQK